MSRRIYKAPSDLTSEKLSLGSHISICNILNGLITCSQFLESPALSGYTEFTMNGSPNPRHDSWTCWIYHAHAVEITCIFTVTTDLELAASDSTTAKTRVLNFHKSIRWPKIPFSYPDRILIGK